MLQKHMPAPAGLMVLGAEEASAFTTAVLYTAGMPSAEIPLPARLVIEKLRKFTNVLPVPVWDQLDFGTHLEHADAIVNMLSLQAALPVMYIDMDPSQNFMQCATKSTCVFNYAMACEVSGIDKGSTPTAEDRVEILCKKVKNCLLSKAQNADGVHVLCLMN